MMDNTLSLQLPQAPDTPSPDSPDHRILGDREHHAEKSRSFSKSLRPKKKTFLGTINVNTLLKTGKLKQLTDVLDKFDIQIAALQETRFQDEIHFDSEGYRIFKGKPAIGIHGNLIQLGTAFAVRKTIINAVLDFTSPSERISVLSVKSGNKAYSLVNAHAPTNIDNKKNPEKVEAFWELLEETTSKIPKHHVKILVGDFNAQVGKERKHKWIVGHHSAHLRTNRNGEHLIDFCKTFALKLMSTHFVKPPHKKKTWKSPNPLLGEFQIDHVAISRKNMCEIQNVRVRKGVVDSDHYLTQIKVRFQPNRCRPKFNRSSRVDPECLRQNTTIFLQDIREQDPKDWSGLRKTLQTSARKLGQPPRKRKHRWWNTTCDKAIDDRTKAWNQWNGHQTTEKWNTFLNVQKTSSKIIRREKRAYDKNRLIEIEQDFLKNNTRNFYKIFRENLSSYQPPSLCFRRANGTLETNTKENCNILADYFRDLLNCDPPKERLSFEKPMPNPDSQPPTIQETAEIIRSLKNNKAPGEDGITAEMCKLGDDLVSRIHAILVEIWETEMIPQDWKCALIHPLHKKGDKADLNNYRGISLLPIAYKILSKALLNRLEKQTDHLIGEYQAGFRKGRSCAEQIWNLKTILRIRRSTSTIVTFVDFKKAYDSVDRQTVFDTLEELGVDKKTRALIQQTLTNTTSKVKFLGEVSEPFDICTGVRQGDGLSPILFNLVLDKVIREWEKDIKGVNVGNSGNKVNVKCLAFADDLAVITKTKDETRYAIQRLHNIASKAGLQISYEKTQYMENLHQSSAKTPLEMENGTISQVSSFKYLGEIILPSGLDSRANVERATKLHKAYRLTWNYYNKRVISRNAKLRHYKTVVLPEALFASETICLGGHSKTTEIEKHERKILRKIYGPTRENGMWIKRRTAELYSFTDRFTDAVRKRRLNFYGHIYRMDDGRLTKRLLKVINSKKVKIKWLEETKSDLQEINITDDIIANRGSFRTKVAKHKFLEKPKKKTGKKWSTERKIQHSAFMKRFWEDKKAKTIKPTNKFKRAL